MSLPATFVASACEALQPLTEKHGFESIKLARSAVAKAARVAQVVQEATPFAGALWAACQEALTFLFAAAWFCALLHGESTDHVCFLHGTREHTPENVRQAIRQGARVHQQNSSTQTENGVSSLTLRFTFHNCW